MADAAGAVRDWSVDDFFPSMPAAAEPRPELRPRQSILGTSRSGITRRQLRGRLQPPSAVAAPAPVLMGESQPGQLAQSAAPYASRWRGHHHRFADGPDRDELMAAAELAAQAAAAEPGDPPAATDRGELMAVAELAAQQAERAEVVESAGGGAAAAPSRKRPATSDEGGASAKVAKEARTGDRQKEEEEEDDDDFMCPICLHLCEAVVESPCGHLFCRGCVMELRGTSPAVDDLRCPVCRVNSRWLAQGELPCGWFPSAYVQRKINATRVPCHYDGCDTIVAKGELKVSQQRTSSPPARTHRLRRRHVWS